MAQPINERPKPMTMEGMIFNANHVLDSALSQDAKEYGIPHDIVERCKGVVLLCVEEAGIVLSGQAGTGVIMKHIKSGEWSNPSALEMQGMGLGIQWGAATKDILVLLMDEKTVNEFGEFPIQLPKIAGQIAASERKVERHRNDLNTFKERNDGSYAYLMTTGLFTGVSLQSATIHCHKNANSKYYGETNVKPQDVFSGKVDPPKGSGIDELHRKLEMLRMGRTYKI